MIKNNSVPSIFHFLLLRGTLFLVWVSASVIDIPLWGNNIFDNKIFKISSTANISFITFFARSTF